MYVYVRRLCVFTNTMHNLTFVCPLEREVTGSHSTRAKKFSFSSLLDLDVTRGSPCTNTAGAATNVSHLKTAVGQN